MASKKHAEVIRAWLDGADIQVHYEDRGWLDCTHDATFLDSAEYRIKPAGPDRVYPETKLSGEDIENFIDARANIATTYTQDLQLAADYVLKHACDAGQIVTREEFDRAVGDRRKRDLAVAQEVVDRAWILIQLGNSRAVREINIDHLVDSVK